MKKLIAILTFAALLFSLAACAPSTPPAEDYVATEAMEVVVAYVGSQAKVITRKLSEKPLSGIKIACVYYDATGAQVGEYEIIEGEIVAEDEVSVWTFNAPVGSVYIDAVVAGVTYEDGTVENCPGIDTWAKGAAAVFDPETRRTLMEARAEKAEQCPALTLKTEFTTDDGLQTTVSNVGDKEIDSVILYNLWYDKDGLAVDVGGAMAINATRSSLSDLAVEETADYTIPTEEGTAKAKQVVEMIHFTDGTSWYNDYVYDWLAANQGSAN